MKNVFFLALMTSLCGSALGQHRVPAPMRDDDAASVVVFLSPWCPISQKYIPTLNAIYDTYAAKNVEFLVLMPGRVPVGERKKFIDDYDVKFAVQADKKFKWTARMEAATTPEVFVFDRNDSLQYRGAIDNWFYDLGRYRSEPTEHYLTDAVDAVLAGETPKVKHTEATGCSIQLPQ